MDTTNINVELTKALSESDQNKDYKEEIRKAGWVPEIMPGEKVLVFRVAKHKTHWERRISRLQIESCFDPGIVKWHIWKDLYSLITDSNAEENR